MVDQSGGAEAEHLRILVQNRKLINVEHQDESMIQNQAYEPSEIDCLLSNH